MTPTAPFDPSPSTVTSVTGNTISPTVSPTPAARPTPPRRGKPRLRTFRNMTGRKLAKSKHNGAAPGAFGRQGARRGGAVQADSSPIIPPQS